MVLPSPPAASAAPLAMLPLATKSVKPDFGSRSAARSAFCGSTMMRLPTGS